MNMLASILVYSHSVDFRTGSTCNMTTSSTTIITIMTCKVPDRSLWTTPCCWSSGRTDTSGTCCRRTCHHITARHGHCVRVMGCNRRTPPPPPADRRRLAAHAAAEMRSRTPTTGVAAASETMLWSRRSIGGGGGGVRASRRIRRAHMHITAR